MKSKQTGGFLLGLIVGVLVGLALALGVALYVTKVPIPFINKVPQRTAEQDAAEAEKNRNWDPNAPLYGKNAAKAAPAASAAIPPAGLPPGVGLPPLPTVENTPAAQAPRAAAAPASRAISTRDPAAILGEKPAATPGERTVATAPVAAAPSTSASADAFVYFVQAGAYARTEEAEQQRAKLAIQGYEARITERDQGGRTVFRVRIGPFERRGDAEAVKTRLGDSGTETALVRAQK